MNLSTRHARTIRTVGGVLLFVVQFLLPAFAEVAHAVESQPSSDHHPTRAAVHAADGASCHQEAVSAVGRGRTGAQTASAIGEAGACLHHDASACSDAMMCATCPAGLPAVAAEHRVRRTACAPTGAPSALVSCTLESTDPPPRG